MDEIIDDENAAVSVENSFWVWDKTEQMNHDIHSYSLETLCLSQFIKIIESSTV